jgi:hypothetical protein
MVVPLIDKVDVDDELPQVLPLIGVVVSLSPESDQVPYSVHADRPLGRETGNTIV